MGYCPFSKIESQYCKLSRHTAGMQTWANQERGTIRPRIRPATRQRGHATRPASMQEREARARGPSCRGSVSRYNKLYRDRKVA